MVSTTTSTRCSSAQSAEEKSSPCEALRSQKGKAYGFQLAQLNETQMEEKGKEINAFWKQVQADGPAGMACVRSMLDSPRRLKTRTKLTERSILIFKARGRQW